MMTPCKWFAVASLPFFAMLSSSEAINFSETESEDLGSELGRARVVEPASERLRAVLICLHGIQSNRDWWLPLGRELAAEGIAVWAYDRPGSGAPSPAGPADITATTWDAQMAQAAAAARKRYGKIPIIAMGVSWGANPATVSAANPANGWAGAVLCNPAFLTRKDGAFMRTVVLSYLNPLTWFDKRAPLHLPLDDDDYTPNPATRKLPYFSPENLKHTATRRFLKTTGTFKKAATSSLATISVPVLV